MNKRDHFLYCIFVSLLICLCGCSAEDENGPKRYTGPTAKLSLRVNGGRSSIDTRTVADSDIEKIRVIIYKSEDGALVSNSVHSISKGSPAVAEVPVAESSKNDFYVICNETTELSALLDKDISRTDLTALLFPTEAVSIPLSSSIGMYGEAKNVEVIIDTDGAAKIKHPGISDLVDKLTVNVKRTMAKLSLKVIKNTEEFTIEAMDYQILRMPATGSLTENVKYTGGSTDTWAPDMRVVGEGKLVANGEYVKATDESRWVKTGGDSIVFPDIYIPEYLMTESDRSLCSYLIITAQCKLAESEKLVEVLYQVDLGNSPPADLNIDRNKHYRIYAVVNALGARGFHAEIVPVEIVEVPVIWQQYQGLYLASELLSEKANVLNDISLDYMQHFGILKYLTVSTDGTTKTSKDALFKYGSVVALDATNTTAFNPATDVLWKPKTQTTEITDWNSIQVGTEDLFAGGIAVENTPERIKQGLGDPCQLVGLLDAEINKGIVNNKAWRMAKPEEYQHLINATIEGYQDASGFASFN